MVIWFACIVGLIAIALATRMYRFWHVYPLALVGSALVLVVSTSPDSYFSSRIDAPNEFDAPAWMLATTGASLMLFAAMQRRTSLAPTSAVVGAYIIFLSASLARAHWVSAPAEIFVAALVPGVFLALVFAVWKFRSRLAVIAALLALIAMDFIGRSDLLAPVGSAIEKGLTQSWIYGPLPEPHVTKEILSAVWIAAFAGLAFFGPKHAASRAALYALIAIGLVAFTRDLSFDVYGLLTPSQENSVVDGAKLEIIQWAVDILWIAASLAIARGKLFSLAEKGESVVAPDVFISYKRDERARVEAIAEGLRALKLSVWFDAKLVAGKAFDDEINQQIRTAKTVLVCWSRGAVASEWVRAEASIARERGVLKACFLEPCDLVPPFNLIHAENLSAGALDGANPAWVRLVDQIGNSIGRPGLGSYLTLGKDEEARKAWLDAFGADPLSDAVKAAK